MGTFGNTFGGTLGGDRRTNLITKKPDELSDVSNYGLYSFDYDYNKTTSSGVLLALMDQMKSNSLGPNVINNPNFDDNSAWSLSTGWSISGGKLIGATGVSSNANQHVGVINALYQVDYNIDSISGGGSVQSLFYPNRLQSTIGQKINDFVANSEYAGIRKNTPIDVVIDNVYFKKYLGNNLTATSLAQQPSITTGYILFNGTTNYLRTAVGSSSIGSVYIIAKKIGIDSDFVVYNTLSGIGEYSGNQLTLGANSVLSSFYNIQVKFILIRSVIDSSETTAKINSYLNYIKKDSIDIYPPGKTSSPATDLSKRKFIVSFADDDASESSLAPDSNAADYPYQGGFFTRLYPVFVAASRYLITNGYITTEIAPSEAAIANTTRINPEGTGSALSTYQMLKYLQDNHSWSINSHSKTHYADSAYVEVNSLDDEIIGSHDLLENWGFNVKTMVYPYSQQSHLIRLKCKEKYVAALVADQLFNPPLNYNIPPLTTYALTRAVIDFTGATNGDCLNYTTAYNSFKTMIDGAKSANGWFITISHSAGAWWKNYNSLYVDNDYPPEWIIPVSVTNKDVPDGWYPYPQSLLSVLYNIIIYIYQQGGVVMQVEDAIQQIGNKYESGDITWGVKGTGAVNDQLYYEHYAIGIDGSRTAYR